MLADTEAQVRLAETALRIARVRLAELSQRLERGRPANHAGSEREGRRYMSVREFAQYVGVSERTLRYRRSRMIEGEHFIRVGSRVLIDAAAAEAFLRSDRTGHRDDLEAVTVDELTRRRAHIARRRTGSGR